MDWIATNNMSFNPPKKRLYRMIIQKKYGACQQDPMSCHSRSSSICSSVRSSSSSPANNWNASWNSAICSSVLRLSWNVWNSPASLWCVQKILELMYGKHKKSNQQIEPESIDLPSSALARIELLFVNGFPVGAWAIGPYAEFETVIEPVMFFVAALPPPHVLAAKTFYARTNPCWLSLGNGKPEQLSSRRRAVEELVQTFMEQLAILQRKTMESQSRAKISAKLLQYASIWFWLKNEFLWVKVIMGHQVPNKIATKRCSMQASCLTHVCAWHFLDETLVQLPCQNWGSKW